MKIMTWQVTGFVHRDTPETQTFVLADHALGRVIQGTSETGEPFTVGVIEYGNAPGWAQVSAIQWTEALERSGFQMARTPDFAEIDFDVDEWHEAEFQAIDAKQIASAILGLRERVLYQRMRDGVLHHVTVGSREPLGSLPVGALWIKADDDPEYYTIPAGYGITSSTGEGFTISMDIDKVDPDVLRILVGDANTIQPMSLELDSTVQPMSLETDGDQAEISIPHEHR